MADQLAQVGELPVVVLMAVLGLVMLFDAVPLFGVLVPGDVAVLAAVAVGSPSTGLATFVAVVTGCLTGWSLSFLVGRRWGDRLRHSRFGGWIGEARWTAAEAILRRDGGRLVLIAPFLPVFNALLPLAAGGLHMPYRRFLGFAALGAAGWTGLYLAVGTASRTLTGLFPAGTSPLLVTMIGGLLLAALVLLGTRRRLRAVSR
ncbi:DedA family protein [Micromonospora lutea]|uniref:VTT domain-containing protein n=1 Tax=Micromonospora lutea TaxID=419825 RepID=A0ABQ4J1A5_9ACTN|nr:VTT domain-containing protein [Micromonospora lutea]GIJ23983.1 hypothetical protein Vlu01_46070 [Micromonospora lutea]